MSDECKDCGRDDGHYLGCAEAAHSVETVTYTTPTSDSKCAQPGCTNPKRPKGKGPAPKYCTEHGDPKNRK